MFTCDVLSVTFYIVSSYIYFTEQHTVRVLFDSADLGYTESTEIYRLNDISKKRGGRGWVEYAFDILKEVSR